MARINGVDLPREKRVEVGLTYLYGIGQTSATKICAETGVNPDTRVKDLTEDDVTKIRDYIDANFTTEGDLRREVRQNVARLMEMGALNTDGLANEFIPFSEIHRVFAQMENPDRRIKKMIITF